MFSMCLIVMLSLVGSIAKAQSTVPVTLKVHGADVHLCELENDRDFIISLSIGQVLASDDLFGYSLYINFDPSVVRMTGGLRLNTLSEHLSEFSTKIYGGTLEIHAVDFIHKTYGDKPLIAFQGEYISDCAGTFTIEIEALEPVDDYKHEVDVSNARIDVYAVIEENDDKFFATTIDSNSLIMPADEYSSSFMITADAFSLAKIDKAEFVISLSDQEFPEFFVIDKIVEKNNVRVTEYLSSEQSCTITANITDDFDSNDIFEVFVSKSDSINATAKLSIKSAVKSECSCVTAIFDDSIIIRSVKDTTTSVVESLVENEINSYYSSGEDVFVIDLKGLKSNKIEIFSTLGYIIKNTNSEILSDEIRIDASCISNGVYFGRISLLDGDVKKIVLIKS